MTVVIAHCAQRCPVGAGAVCSVIAVSNNFQRRMIAGITTTRRVFWRSGLIILLSSGLVALVTWFVPTLTTTTVNALFRVRGALRPSSDLVIVAIDDASLQQLGQWPWPRTVMAATLDRLTAAEPRAIGLDVIYAEPTEAAADAQLAGALQRNGRVVLPAQLFDAAPTPATVSPDTARPVKWLRPLPLLEQAAAALGHVHVAPAVDGMVRSLQLSKADASGERRWAFGLAVLQIADQLAPADFSERARQLRVGKYAIPVLDEMEPTAVPGVTRTRPNEMLINFAGPTGTFAQYSLADVYAGRVAPSAFAGKLVLIGATAASLGDARIVPFMHFQTAEREGGLEMPGVEIHANIIHSIRQQLALRALPDWVNFMLAVLVILLVTGLVSRLAGWQQIGALALLLGLILLGSYGAFARGLVIPPLVPMLTGFLAVVPLLLNRALLASRELDQKLAALAQSQQGLVAQTQLPSVASRTLPLSLAAKLRTVDDLTTRLLARMSFINRTLTSMTEGVLVTDQRGRITFANREAEQLFGLAEARLRTLDLAQLFAAASQLATSQLTTSQSAQDQLLAAWQAAQQGRSSQIEVALSAKPALGTSPATTRHFTLSLAPLATETQPAQPVGVVLLFADITKRVELDRVKTETLQLVSHELRTPLTSIQGLSDVLLKFPVDAAQTREMHSTIHAEAVRLSETINRYLDLTRLESGAQTLQRVPLNVAQLLHNSVRQVSGYAAERQIQIQIECPPDLPALTGDAQLLTQALGNLLSNAVKYSPPATTIRLGAALDASAAEWLLLKVCDEGLGIPPAAAGRIFEKFYRLQRDTQAGVIGTGLGLALVKEIAEKHQGQIQFANNPTGGTTFTLRLPCQPLMPDISATLLT